MDGRSDLLTLWDGRDVYIKRDGELDGYCVSLYNGVDAPSMDNCDFLTLNWSSYADTQRQLSEVTSFDLSRLDIARIKLRLLLLHRGDRNTHGCKL